jgi:two-component sensor histidine kinase
MNLKRLTGLLQMWRYVGTLQRWSLWARIAITAAAVVATHLLQIPLEQDIPGEPFLLFFLVVTGVTLAFGAGAGFVGVAMTTVLSVLFFEPVGSLGLVHAADLIKVEVYAVLATAWVFAFARLCDALSAATLETATLKRAEEKSSLLFSELAHGVANNFAAIAALITLKSHSVKDRKARAVLDEAIEQVNVMGRVHARLRAGDQVAWLDSQAFFGELCEDLKASVARGRQVSIECKADNLPMCMDQAMSLGLIVNELVTNAMKHAFPHGRAGRIRVAFEAVKGELRLCVEDDGVGFGPRMRKGSGMGRDLVSGLAGQLGGHLEVASTNAGSSFRLSVPFANPVPPTRSEQPAAALVH